MSQHRRTRAHQRDAETFMSILILALLLVAMVHPTPCVMTTVRDVMVSAFAAQAGTLRGLITPMGKMLRRWLRTPALSKISQWTRANVRKLRTRFSPR